MKRVALIVDNPLRDLEGNVLLAVKVLELVDAKVYLVPMYQKEAVFFIRPDLLLVNFARADNKRFISLCQDAGIRIGVLDTEGGVFQDTQKAFNAISQVLRELPRSLDFYCVWGPTQGDALAATGVLNKAQIFVTGTPRLDFAHTSFSGYKGEFEEEIKNLQPYILINTNFPVLKPRFQSAEAEKQQLVRVHGWTPERVEKLISEATAARGFVIEVIKSLAVRYSEKRFILRPHPFEDESIYVEELGSLPNFLIRRQGSVLPWLKRAELLIHRNCSTAIEMLLFGKEAINIDHPDTPSLIQPIIHALSFQAKEFEDLYRYIERYDEEGTLSVSAEMKQKRAFLLSRHFHLLDGQASNRVAQVIVNYLEDDRGAKIRFKWKDILSYFWSLSGIRGIARLILTVILGARTLEELGGKKGKTFTLNMTKNMVSQIQVALSQPVAACVSRSREGLLEQRMTSTSVALQRGKSEEKRN